MTDANLMDANCVHGVVWYECNTCDQNKTALERWPNHGMTRVHSEMGKEIDRLNDRVTGMERREVTFRSEIDARDDFIQRLMAELAQWGWGDVHYPGQHQAVSVVTLLKEGGFGNYGWTIMQEGNIYERDTEAPSTDVAPPATSNRGPGEWEDTVGGSRGREEPNGPWILCGPRKPG